MKLKDFITESGMPITVFSHRCGVTTRTIYRILNGRCDLRLSLALKIEEVTKGQVTPYDLAPKKKKKS